MLCSVLTELIARPGFRLGDGAAALRDLARGRGISRRARCPMAGTEVAYGAVRCGPKHYLPLSATGSLPRTVLRVRNLLCTTLTGDTTCD